MSSPHRILVVEDSRDLLEELVDFLRFSGFDAEGVTTLAAMRARLQAETWQLLVLDLGLPDGDGLSAARELRARHALTLGLVMMTARGQVDDRVAGLTAGADSYLTKPVALRELKAVIDNVLQRLPPLSASSASAPHWQLDSATLHLRSPGGARLLLTGTEARLIARLFEARGEVLGREALCRALDPRGFADDTRRLDTLVSRLRSKVEHQCGEALPIRTFRNLGYAFGGPLGV